MISRKRPFTENVDIFRQMGEKNFCNVILRKRPFSQNVDIFRYMLYHEMLITEIWTKIYFFKMILYNVVFVDILMFSDISAKNLI